MYFEEDAQENGPMYIHTILEGRHNFWKRLWYGLRYIFLGDISKYGVSQEAVIYKEQAEKIRDVVNLYLESHNDSRQVSSDTP